ncbi:hypothetical protein FOHLNKBM_0177 [Methylobacterium longum]|nr:hypothetical protein FOHLNKBM_0177 [Methylobacterium longum]
MDGAAGGVAVWLRNVVGMWRDERSKLRRYGSTVCAVSAGVEYSLIVGIENSLVGALA